VVGNISKKTMDANEKKRRKEIKIEKAKRKNLLIATVCGCLTVVAVVVLVMNFAGAMPFAGQQGGAAETYSGGGQIVQLLPDGRFSAALAHNVRKSGTYTRSVEDGRTVVTFNRDGIQEVGWIENNALHIPDEWDDGCGHGRVLPRR